MRKSRITAVGGWLIVAGTGLAQTACSNEDASTEGSTGIKALALTSDGTDVEGIRFDVTPVDCGDGSPTGPTTTEIEPIDPDQTLPGNLPELENNPLDEDSSHLFADSFQVVPAGCYNVVAIPVQDDGDRSADCAKAFKNGVVVKEGLTTEIFMINQCKGEDPGAVDIIAALNHEPTLEDLTFSDSKFSCGSPTEVCAEGSDPDSDPIELVLSSDDCDVAPLPGDDPSKQCWELTCHKIGKHNLKVTVYDLLHGTTSDPQRIEDWLAEQGYPNESHAELSFHAYVDGVEMWPDTDGDGHGDADAEATVFCEGDDTDGYVTNHDDCDDSDPSTYPGASEVCGDDVDNDCDGATDEDCSFPGCEDGGFTCGEPGDFACECGDSGICATTTEGDAQCVVGSTSCGGLVACTTSADCPDEGARCLINTCCGGKVCVTPPTQLCPTPDADHVDVTSTEDGPTIAG